VIQDLQPLFELLPLEKAMPTLLATTPGPAEAIACVETLEATPVVKAALWLYVDHLENAHHIVQDLHTPTGAFLHGMVHRREGDFSNSKYWFRQAGHHPVIDQLIHYEPYDLVTRAEEARADNPAEVVALQRAEWQAIFDYAVRESA
jgi:hypothetical protein